MHLNHAKTTDNLSDLSRKMGHTAKRRRIPNNYFFVSYVFLNLRFIPHIILHIPDKLVPRLLVLHIVQRAHLSSLIIVPAQVCGGKVIAA